VYEDVVTLPREEKNIEVVLDELLSSKKEVIELGIQAGDIISFEPRTRMTSSGFIKSRHLDDKAGAAILLAFAKWAVDHRSSLKRGIKLAFTSFEEVGHGGSSGFSEEEEEMIAVDMGAMGDDLQGKETAVSICAKDSGGPYHYDVTSRLLLCAKKENLPYAVDIFPRYGSDVEASLRAGYNVMHGLIGPGVFASHGYERTHIEGLRSTLHLICAYCSGQDRHP
jgi:putative aminopeptidase FrvX